MGADVGEAFNKAEASLQSLLLPEALPTPTLYSPYLYTHGYILTSLPRPLGLWERTLWWLLSVLCHLRVLDMLSESCLQRSMGPQLLALSEF